MVAVERQTLQQLEAAFGSLRHGDGDRAIQLDDRGRRVALELRVEEGDFTPVGLRLGVKRGDRGLELVGTRPTPGDRLVERRLPGLDLVPIPERPVLLVEQDDRAVGNAGVAARVLQQHERQQAEGLGLVGHQDRERAGESDGLG